MSWLFYYHFKCLLIIFKLISKNYLRFNWIEAISLWYFVCLSPTERSHISFCLLLCFMINYYKWLEYRRRGNESSMIRTLKVLSLSQCFSVSVFHSLNISLIKLLLISIQFKSVQTEFSMWLNKECKECEFRDETVQKQMFCPNIIQFKFSCCSFSI